MRKRDGFADSGLTFDRATMPEALLLFDGLPTFLLSRRRADWVEGTLSLGIENTLHRQEVVVMADRNR